MISNFKIYMTQYNGIFRSDEVNESIRKKFEFVEKDNAF